MTGIPELSVVIGSKNARNTIREGLLALRGTATAVEIIVADASTDGTAEIIVREFGDVVLIRGSASDLIPHLWGKGLARARAPLVAITNALCVPRADWIENLIRAAGEHAHDAGIGGPIDPPDGSSPIDFAVYLARYSSYMPPIPTGAAVEIPGDNAVYRKTALDEAWTDRSDGFWETLVHARLRGLSCTLTMDEQVRVRSGSGVRPWDFIAARFRHGRHYGSTRLMSGMAERCARLAASPVLAPVLLLRTARRTLERRPRWMGRYLLASPWLALFVGAWSAGEICGYLAPRRRSV